MCDQGAELSGAVVEKSWRLCRPVRDDVASESPCDADWKWRATFSLLATEIYNKRSWIMEINSLIIPRLEHLPCHPLHPPTPPPGANPAGINITKKLRISRKVRRVYKFSLCSPIRNA